MLNGILIGGKCYSVLHPVTGTPIPVLGPQDHKIEFKVGEGYNKRRAVPIDLGVFHWTGDELPVENMARILGKMKLGVEFAIAPHGVLYQFCDPTVVNTADAGEANARSWGVEITNAGIRSMSTLWRAPQYKKIPMGPRDSYETVIHGKKVKCWDFYPEQKATAFALNVAMVRAIPTYYSEVCVTPGVVDLSATRGAIGHYNVTTNKLDPGTRFMNELAEFMEKDKIPESLLKK